MLRLIGVALAAAILVAAGLWLTRPRAVTEAEIAGIEPDLVQGELLYYAAGCGSCHAAPGASDDAARKVLAGGARFEAAFGTFIAPNITPDPDAGIGSWTRAEVISAISRGTSPGGQHYFPALPYTAYGKAELADLVSLTAYLETLPPDPTPNAPHDVGFPFNIRALVGGWKLLFADSDWVLDAGGDPVLERGRYLVEALSHCGECHTPRNALGGLDRSRWLGGAPNPSGRGSIPNITPGGLNWSMDDIAAYLESGFTPDFDVVGGSMAAVVRNYAKLSNADRIAVATYLKAVPAVE